MKIEFVLDMSPRNVNSEWSMNRVYSGAHWTARNSQAKYMHTLVRKSIKKLHVPVMPFKKPVSIDIKYNSRLDIDNHGYLSKLIIDGMKGILILDDNRSYVKKLTQSFHDENKNLIFVSVSDD